MNARQELQYEFDRIGKKPVCASIQDGWGGYGKVIATLKKGHTDQEFEEFMNKLDLVRWFRVVGISRYSKDP